MDKRASSYTVGRPANWYSKYGKQWKFLKKLEIELPYEPVIPLLGTHTEEIKLKETHVPQCSLQH